LDFCIEKNNIVIVDAARILREIVYPDPFEKSPVKSLRSATIFLKFRPLRKSAEYNLREAAIRMTLRAGWATAGQIRGDVQTLVDILRMTELYVSIDQVVVSGKAMINLGSMAPKAVWIGKPGALSTSNVSQSDQYNFFSLGMQYEDSSDRSHRSWRGRH
jgi:hypothetical protein